MRRLIAFLALLSGLTAMGAPVHAAMLSGAAAQMTSASVSQSEKRTQNECHIQRKAQSDKAPSSNGSRRLRTIAIVIPTVQIGSDRAFE